MFTDLTDHVDRFKREVAPLGQFESLNADVFDSDVAWALADAFGEAQMMGMFPAHTLDGTDVTPALSPREVSVVVAFAGGIIAMPGLPKAPAALTIDVDENGDILGLF